MTDEAVFLAAIRADPADDLPRLVYADWLEEHGQPERAEFIRLHIYLHQQYGISSVITGTNQITPILPEDSDAFRVSMQAVTAFTNDPSKTGLRGRLLDLADRNQVDWHRGFIRRLSCWIGDWTGGRCGSCRGSGRRTYRTGSGGLFREECNTCFGSGVTAGIGPQVVVEHPVEVVHLLDKHPRPLPDGLWSWLRVNELNDIAPDNEHAIPIDVFERLTDWITNDDSRRVYLTREAAESALSAALIRFASTSRTKGLRSPR